MQNLNRLMINEPAKQPCRSWAKLRFFFLIGILLATGCATTIVYQTGFNTEKQPQMSLSDARRTLLQTLQQAYCSFGTPLQEIHLTSDGFSFVEPIESGGAQVKTHGYRFSEIQHLAVRTVTGLAAYRVNLGDTEIWWVSPKEACDRDNARRFVDAINAIKYYSSSALVANDATAFAEFKEKARTWRALPVKPALPEEVQRFRVLAEDAFRNKNFEDAVEYYEQGLAVTPLWPEGHFNAALFYGELQLYGQAVIHMKRYLELSPDAKNAKTAREKMYVWEEKARKAATSSSTESSPAKPNEVGKSGADK